MLVVTTTVGLVKLPSVFAGYILGKIDGLHDRQDS